MRNFVTGSTGFIGSHFLRAALLAGHEMVALRYPGSQPVIPIPDSDRLTWIDGDLNSFLTDVSAFQHFSFSVCSRSLRCLRSQSPAMQVGKSVSDQCDRQPLADRACD